MIGELTSIVKKTERFRRVESEGKLVRIRVTLPADVGLGVSLSFEATVFVTTDWPIGRNFIGYCGFVQGIRIALDPQNNVFYFGSY